LATFLSRSDAPQYAAKNFVANEMEKKTATLSENSTIKRMAKSMIA
jgi:hypothetical protein